MIIALGNDHGALNLRASVIGAIKDLGHTLLDFGTDTDASVDYPDYAAKVAAAIVAKDADLGIVMCGTGIGISIAANKIKGIRCAHVTDLFSATMCREHNNANVLSLGGRITSPENAALFTKTFLTTPFDSKNDRHSRRIDKIGKLES